MDHYFVLQTGVEAESATCVIELADAGGTGDHALSERACPGAQPDAQGRIARARTGCVHSEATGAACVGAHTLAGHCSHGRA